MTRRRLQLAAAVVFVLGLTGASIALASGGDKGHGKHGKNFRAKMIGFNEVPATNSKGQGKLRLSMTDTQITFRLDYSGLSGNPAASHIHVGQKNVNGGVAVFFCGGGGKPPCPASTSVALFAASLLQARRRKAKKDGTRRLRTSFMLRTISTASFDCSAREPSAGGSLRYTVALRSGGARLLAQTER